MTTKTPAELATERMNWAGDDLDFDTEREPQRQLPEIPADADDFTRALLERERYMLTKDPEPGAD